MKRSYRYDPIAINNSIQLIEDTQNERSVSHSDSEQNKQNSSTALKFKWINKKHWLVNRSQERDVKTSHFTRSIAEVDEEEESKFNKSWNQIPYNPQLKKFWDQKRITNVAKPKIMNQLVNKRPRNTSKSMRNRKLIHLSRLMNANIPCRDEGKQIIYQTLKASVYGVDVKEIPLLERKLNAYWPSNKKTRRMIVNSLCLNRFFTKSNDDSKIKIKSRQTSEINRLKESKTQWLISAQIP